jgi:hypothetical protein
VPSWISVTKPPRPVRYRREDLGGEGGARGGGQLRRERRGVGIDDLERLGYAERRPDPADRRAKLIYPTERGLLQMKAATSITRKIEERHAEALGTQEYAAFKGVLRRVADLKREAGESTAASASSDVDPNSDS